MNLLFYYPSNKRTISLETLLIELKKKGYYVMLLTTCEKGDFHLELERNGIPTYTNSIAKKSNALSYYLRQVFFLINFCKTKKIDFVFSHLQHVNIISVIAQFFIRSKVVAFRHHFKFYSDKNLQVNKNEKLGDLFINKLARHIVVPSSGVYNGMKGHEKVDMKKVKIIPYLYDFSKYSSPVKEEVAKIRERYKCRLLLIMCARLIPFKRHNLVFPIVNKLVRSGFQIKLLVLDEGPEKSNLERYIQENGLKDYIVMLGFKRDFINYMAASDLLIHPSLTEASNSVVKEMGILEKAVAVCEGVGDFDDYITEEVNGFFLPQANPEEKMEKLIKLAYNDPEALKKVGRNLRDDVLRRFNLSREILGQYDVLIDQVNKDIPIGRN